MYDFDLSPMYDLSVFGQAATYTDRNGVSTPCAVIVEPSLQAYGQTAHVNVGTAVLSVQVAVFPAAPRRGETFTLLEGGKVYAVDSLQSSDELEHKVFVA